MKTCCRCKIQKDESCFSNRSKGKLQPYCKACHSIYLKQHYQNNKQYYKDKAKISRADSRQWFRDLKAMLSCAICTESTSACLDFHHLDGENKESLVSEMANQGSAKETILKEISKCIVLCANCHRKLHNGVLSYWSPRLDSNEHAIHYGVIGTA